MLDKVDSSHIKPMLDQLIRQLDNYDISSFKERLRVIIEAADTRDVDDKTDFEFLQRRSADRE